MKTLKNRKWYSPHLMRRATKPTIAHRRLDVSAVRITEGGECVYIASTKGCVTTPRGMGYAKEFARATQSIPPERLMILAHADKVAAEQWCEMMNKQNAERSRNQELNYTFRTIVSRPVKRVTITAKVVP